MRFGKYYQPLANGDSAKPSTGEDPPKLPASGDPPKPSARGDPSKPPAGEDPPKPPAGKDPPKLPAGEDPPKPPAGKDNDKGTTAYPPKIPFKDADGIVDIKIFKTPEENMQKVLNVLQQEGNIPPPEKITEAVEAVNDLVLIMKSAEQNAATEKSVENCKQRFYKAVAPGTKTEAQEVMLAMGLAALVKLKCPECTLKTTTFTPPSNYPGKEDLYEIGRCILTRTLVEKGLTPARLFISEATQKKITAKIAMGIGKIFVDVLAIWTGLGVFTFGGSMLKWIDSAMDKGFDLAKAGTNMFVGLLLGVVGPLFARGIILKKTDPLQVVVGFLAKIATRDLPFSPQICYFALAAIHVSFEVVRSFGLPELSEANSVEEVQRRLKLIVEKKPDKTYSRKAAKSFKWVCGKLKPKNKWAAVAWPILFYIYDYCQYGKNGFVIKFTEVPPLHDNTTKKGSETEGSETVETAQMEINGTKVYSEDLKKMLKIYANPFSSAQCRKLILKLEKKGLASPLKHSEFGVMDELVSMTGQTLTGRSGTLFSFWLGDDTIGEKLISSNPHHIAPFTFVLEGYLGIPASMAWGLNVGIDLLNWGQDKVIGFLPSPKDTFGTSTVVRVVSGQEIQWREFTPKDVEMIFLMWREFQFKEIHDVMKWDDMPLKRLRNDVEFVRTSQEWRQAYEHIKKVRPDMKTLQERLLYKALYLEDLKQRISDRKVRLEPTQLLGENDEYQIFLRKELRDMYIDSFKSSRQLKRVLSRLDAFQSTSGKGLPRKIETMDYEEDPRTETNTLLQSSIQAWEDIEKETNAVVKYINNDAPDLFTDESLFSLEDVAMDPEAAKIWELKLNESPKELEEFRKIRLLHMDLPSEPHLDGAPVKPIWHDYPKENTLREQFEGKPLLEQENKIFNSHPDFIKEYAKSLNTSRMVKRLRQRYSEWFVNPENNIIEHVHEEINKNMYDVNSEKEKLEKSSNAVYEWLKKGNDPSEGADFELDDVFNSEKATKIYIKGETGSRLPLQPGEEKSVIKKLYEFWSKRQSYLSNLVSEFTGFPDWVKPILDNAVTDGILNFAMPTLAAGGAFGGYLAVVESDIEEEEED